MRDLHADTLAALSQPNVRWIVMVRMHLDSGVITWHTGYNDFTFDGYEYLAVGHLGTLSKLDESSEAKPNKIKVGMSGINDSMVALLLGEEFLGRWAYVHLAVCDEAWQVIGDPILWFYGKMDPPGGKQGATAEFEVTINSRLADWDRQLVEIYSDVDQQARFPGDLGLEFAEQVAANGLVEADK